MLWPKIHTRNLITKKKKKKNPAARKFPTPPPPIFFSNLIRPLCYGPRYVINSIILRATRQFCYLARMKYGSKFVKFPDFDELYLHQISTNHFQTQGIFFQWWTDLP